MLLQGITIECGNAWAAMDPATMSEHGASVFTPASVADAEQSRRLCGYWPHDPGAQGTVRSDAPIVFLNGTVDPADPPANVAAAPSTMPNALLVSVPGSAH